MPALGRQTNSRHSLSSAGPAANGIELGMSAVSNSSLLANMGAGRANPDATPTLSAMGGQQAGATGAGRPSWAREPGQGLGRRVMNAVGGALTATSDVAGSTLNSARELVGNGLSDAREMAARSGMLRVGMDNRFPGPGADTTAYISEEEAAQEYFDERLAAAQAYLAERGMDGTIAAKLVTADIVNLAGGDPVEHAEWQMHLVPHEGESPVQGVIDPKNAPGMFDENRLQEFVESQGVRSEGSEILRSEDNPLFLGRLNYGTAGSGMYTKVPDYGEIGGHNYNTREVEMMTTITPDQASAAIEAMYTDQSRPYLGDGVCHQGAALAGEAFGLDPKDVASHVGSAWATRLRFGRTGLDGGHWPESR